MKRLLVILLTLLPFASYGIEKQDFVSSICENGKVCFSLNVEFAPQSNDDVVNDFGTASHHGVTKIFDGDTAVVAIVGNALKEALLKVERGVVADSEPSALPESEPCTRADVSCRILSASSTIEETRGGAYWGGIWASIKLEISIRDRQSGQVYYSDTIFSEGRSRGGFNINLSGIEDAAGRMACFLGEDLRVAFPVHGRIIGPYNGPKSAKTAFVVNLGTDDNVYSGGLATYRVSKVVEDGDSFKLVEIGSGYIFDVLQPDQSIFRITYGASAVKKAYEDGETLIIRSR